MSIARNLLLTASRSQWMAHQLRERAFMRRAVRRFMPGEDVSAALDATAELAKVGVKTILTQLGENISSLAEGNAVRDHYLGVYQQLTERKLDAAISVKLTQLGIDVDKAACIENCRMLARAAKAHGSTFWVDIEYSNYVDVTLEIYKLLLAEFGNVGLALQAYLYRTQNDLDGLLPMKPTIRLVKGAYNEAASVAFPKKSDVDENYYKLACTLLEATKNGTHAIFGTHDLDLQRRIEEKAKAINAPNGMWEVHMLYGIRSQTQRELAARGIPVRCLISYGRHWYAWYMRRLAERPANTWFVVRSMFMG